MELLQLQYFYESAKHQSFSKTAEKYMVAATSVSASVKRLEKELGCELFYRLGNRIILNDNGKKLKQSLSFVFDELNQAVDSLTAKTHDTREIKMLVRTMREKTTELIIEYKAKHPHISFKTVFDFEETNFENYHIIIDGKSDHYDGFKQINLYTTNLHLRVSSKNHLCGKKLTLNQLSNEPFISIGENNNLHKILIRACRKAGFVPNIVVQCNDIKCNERFVEADIGIEINRDDNKNNIPKNIQILDVLDFKETQTICAYYKEGTAYGNVEHFLNFLQTKTL